MKKLFTFLFMTVVYGLTAQITVTSADMPSPGDTIRTSLSIDNGSYDFTRTGNGYTWDFATLTPLSQAVDTFLSITQTPVSFWPFFITSANLATKINPASILPGLPSLEAYRFYNNTNASFKDVGYGLVISGIPLPLKYSNADMIYKFPMNIGTTHESASGLAVSIPNMAYIMIDRNRISIVDGWGTLTTPYGTFDVLRLKSTVSEYDSIYIDSLQQGIPLNRNYIEYQWIGKNFGLPLLNVTVDDMFGTSVVYRDSLRNIYVGIPEKELAQHFNIMPNPVHDRINLQCNFKQDCLSNISILDITGQCFYRVNGLKIQAGEHAFPLSLNAMNIPAGVYVVLLNTDNQLFVSRFVKN